MTTLGICRPGQILRNVIEEFDFRYRRTRAIGPRLRSEPKTRDSQKEEKDR